MKTKKYDCKKCGAKKSVTMTSKVTDSGVIFNLYKCSECNELPDLKDFEPIFHEPKDETYYGLD